MKKKLSLLILILVLIFAMCGCQPIIKLKDVYVNYPDITEFDGYDELGELPAGVEVAYKYHKAGTKYKNPFFRTRTWVVVKLQNNNYGVYNYAKQEWVINKEQGCDFIRKNENFIVYQDDKSNDIFLVDCDSLKEINLKTEFNIRRVEDVILPSEDSKYVLCEKENYSSYNDVTYQVFNKNGYLTQIYTEIKLDGASYGTRCEDIKVYDNYIVQSNKSHNSPASVVALYKMTDKADSLTTVTRPRHIFDADDVFPSYVSNGNFYIYMQDRADSNEYDYKEGNNYYKGVVKMYNINEDSVVDKKSSTYYKEIITKDNERIGNEIGDINIAIDEILRDGYMFVSSGFGIDKNTKTILSDQFIINKDYEVVASLSGKFGKDIKLNSNRIDGFSPLMLLFIDGKGFSPNMDWDSIRIVNIDGTTAFEKSGLFKNLFYNNDALVCQKLVKDEKDIIETSQKIRYGAYDKNGKTIIDFKYDYMTPFISGYALASDTYVKDDDETEVRYFDIYKEKVDGKDVYFRPDGTRLVNQNPKSLQKFFKVYRVDKFGNEKIIEDIAKTRKNDKLVFKVGAYVCNNGDATYNVKTISGKKLFTKDFTDVVIDKPTINDVTICGKLDGKYHIYLLTSTRGTAEVRTINDVIVPSVIIGSMLIVSVVMVLAIKLQKNNNAVKVSDTNAVETKNDVSKEAMKKVAENNKKSAKNKKKK